MAPTPATLFRTAQDHTQLLDEVDSWTNDADLKDILNAGYEKGGVVTRCDRTARGFKPTEFPVFAPRALAGIGLNKLHQTTLDRTFAIAMVRQMKGEKRERLRPCKVRSTASQLKKEIQKWVKANKEQVVAVYERGDFQYLERFSDRTVDIAEPLAAIVEVTYSGHAELELTRALLVGAIATTRKEQQSA